MTVRRIHTANGSHIEPPLDESWTPQQKLEWQAAVVAHDTGLRIEVRPGRIEFDGVSLPDVFSVNVDSSSTVLSYAAAWTYLWGVDMGARRNCEHDWLDDTTLCSRYRRLFCNRCQRTRWEAR